MENLKQSRASEDKDGIDMISKMPDPILHLILSRLSSTEEVIRTSILSRRWRYFWTSVPSVDIDYSRRLNPHKEFKIKKFEEFVCRVLVNKSLDLDSFRLSCGNYYNMLTVRRWIDAAVRRNVKLLDLMFCVENEYDDIELPRCLVTCGSLEVLRLHLFGRCLRLPNFRGFSMLRVLELNSVQLFDGGLATDLLKRCPLLEDLKLKNLMFSRKLDMVDGDFHRSIQISCPKLVCLELTGYIGHLNIISKSLDSLKKAVINLKGSPSEFIMGNTIRELFAGISHVEFLSLNPFIILKCIDAASLPNLKTLELMVTIDDFPMDDLIQILKCYPHLEALHLIIQDVVSYERRNPYQFAHRKLDEVETRRILTRHLKRVEFLEFNREDPSLSMALSLLLYGNALKEMVFTWDNKDKYLWKSTETMKEVSTFHKASSTVKLITLLKEKD